MVFHRKWFFDKIKLNIDSLVKYRVIKLISDVVREPELKMSRDNLRVTITMRRIMSSPSIWCIQRHLQTSFWNVFYSPVLSIYPASYHVNLTMADYYPVQVWLSYYYEQIPRHVTPTVTDELYPGDEVVKNRLLYRLPDRLKLMKDWILDRIVYHYLRGNGNLLNLTSATRGRMVWQGRQSSQR